MVLFVQICYPERLLWGGGGGGFFHDSREACNIWMSAVPSIQRNTWCWLSGRSTSLIKNNKFPWLDIGGRGTLLFLKHQKWCGGLKGGRYKTVTEMRNLCDEKIRTYTHKKIGVLVIFNIFSSNLSIRCIFIPVSSKKEQLSVWHF